MDFWKVIYENLLSLSLSLSLTHTHTHTQTDILKFYEELFCTYCKARFVLSLKTVIMLISSIYP